MALPLTRHLLEKVDQNFTEWVQLPTASATSCLPIKKSIPLTDASIVRGIAFSLAPTKVGGAVGRPSHPLTRELSQGRAFWGKVFEVQRNFF